jgi:hypothetical protein
VGKTGCDHDVPGGDLQLALSQAAAHSGEDTVKLGPILFQQAGGYGYASSDPVHIEGDGGVASGRLGTTLADSTSNPSGETVLRVFGTAASTIKGIDVRVPGGTGSSNSGIDTNAAMDDVQVETEDPASTGATGVTVEEGGALTNSRVQMSTKVASSGLVFAGPSVHASDSRIKAVQALANANTGLPDASASRLTVVYSGSAAIAPLGHLSIEDSSFEPSTDSAFVQFGLEAFASAGDATLTANHLTMVGSPAGGGVAFKSVASNGHTANLSVRNSVATVYPNAFQRVGSTGSTANITTDYSDYGGATVQDAGPGKIAETNHLSTAPGFLSATDYHLRADSPLVDAGDPTGLPAGESTTDASGQPRIVDGDGNCSARRDIGAYEFQPGPRDPHAAAAAAPGAAFTGQAVTFDAAGSCDPDGDALTYAWTFDDGGGAPGTSVQRTFSSPGIRFGTVTVTDTSGRSATATASVFVAYPPFAGVAIGHGKVRASRKGAVKVNASCPASTVGRCAGTLTLDGARVGFSIPAGGFKVVTLKLSKTKLKALRKKRRQTFTAVAIAHDANGTSHTSSAKLTLLAPR